jgi:hypothetical protein
MFIAVRSLNLTFNTEYLKNFTLSYLKDANTAYLSAEVKGLGNLILSKGEYKELLNLKEHIDNAIADGKPLVFID